jgi:hypothetical protein
MIEEYPPGRSERNTAGPALHQLYADLQLEIANLPAQRWLRGVQSPLGGIREAATILYPQ